MGAPANAATELRAAVRSLSLRGLTSSSRWAAELLVSLSSLPIENISYGSDEEKTINVTLGNANPSAETSAWLKEADEREVDDFTMLGKVYFDSREYRRCARVLANTDGRVGRFLRRYALYLAGEKRKEEERQELSDWREPENEELAGLRRQLEEQMEDNEVGGLDPYEEFLLGVVYKKLDMKEDAKRLLVGCVKRMPYLWGAWLELCSLIGKGSEAEGIAGMHWVGSFFLGKYYVGRVDNEGARNVYEDLEVVWPASMHVKSHLALALYNSREFDEAEEIFERLTEHDSYWLDLVDVYSNILFVKEKKKNLSHLAHRCVSIDKYRTQTCCVIGNYYALRKEHHQAVTYFQRALKLDRHYLTAWILIGHEYIELKNPAAAVEAYRRAVDINPWDFRAWYGLGQTYELLNMQQYTLHYYRKVTSLQPSDARMWCAVGEAYAELNRIDDAIKAYERAVSCDDEEGVALSQLAILYENASRTTTESVEEMERLKQRASECHAAYLRLLDEEGRGAEQEAAASIRYLAESAAEKGELKEAARMAERLMELGGTHGQYARRLLREVENNLAEREESEAHGVGVS